MKKLLTLSLISSLLIFAQCKKDKNTPEPDNPYGLPNATQTGANVFACRVNGVNWISKTGSTYMGGVMNDTIAVKGGRNVSNAENVFLLLKGSINADVTYNVGSDIQITYTTTKLCDSNIINFYAYEAVSGTIKLSKIDFSKKILSGTFSFRIVRQECSDTLHFTDGRFDIRYF